MKNSHISMPDALWEVELEGCTPEPLMAYLKALGILRLVSQQRDPEARGWWKDDTFHLRSTLDGESLVKFFLEEYEPTPIVAPWAGGSGFFSKDNKDAICALLGSTATRVSKYRSVIKMVQSILEKEGIHDKPMKEEKVQLIRRYRRELPEEIVRWIDAALVIKENGQNFAPLLGTGGNDGRLDFTQNFMQRIVALELHVDGPSQKNPGDWLKQSLFSATEKLRSASVGQFAPGRAGGPNATQGMEGKPTDNPWDFILMLEGTLLFAGGVAKRFGSYGSDRASFPFTVEAVSAGSCHSDMKEQTEARGELWLPLWNRPAKIEELKFLLGEGRAEVGRRQARDGVDFARAVAGLGVDRGIGGFNRFGFLKRSGKAFLATPLTRIRVEERAEVDHLREIDTWLYFYRRILGEKAPSRHISALRRLDSNVFEFCKYGGSRFFQEILIALGNIERELALTAGKVGNKVVSPVPLLSAAWVEAADDGSSEFALARALASIHDQQWKIGPLRANLEPVDWKNYCRTWAEKERTIVWNTADLATNMINVLQRRMMDGIKAGCEHLPLDAGFKASLIAVSKFLDGRLDFERIEELIWGLILVEIKKAPTKVQLDTGDFMLPRPYALLKMLFLTRPMVMEKRDNDKSLVRLLGSGEQGGIAIRPEPSILQLLKGNRVGEASAIGMRRLRASGLNPMPGAISGQRFRDGDWRELDRMGSAGIDPLRLAASLLIPIPGEVVGSLAGYILIGD